jgi:hypothetical protein
MSSLSSRAIPPDLQPVDNLSQHLGGFPLAELRHAMPPAAPTTSVDLTKPEHLDQGAIDQLMSPGEPPPAATTATSTVP